MITFAVASNYYRFILIIFIRIRSFLKHGFALLRHHTCPNRMQSVDNEVISIKQKGRNFTETNQLQKTTSNHCDEISSSSASKLGYVLALVIVSLLPMRNSDQLANRKTHPTLYHINYMQCWNCYQKPPFTHRGFLSHVIRWLAADIRKMHVAMKRLFIYSVFMYHVYALH